MKYLKYIAGIIVIIIILLIMVLIYNDKITQNSPLYYKQGIEFYNNGDYQNAYYNFGKIKLISPLYSMAIYRQAKSAQKLGDYNTAVLKYELFLKKSSNSVFTNNAKNNLAKCYFYLKKYDDAKKQFEDINEKNPDNISNNDYFLGIIEKNYNKQAAENYFKNYLKKSIYNDKYTKEYLMLAADELSTLGVNLSDEDLKLLGIAYYKSKNYNKALEYFTKLPIEQCWEYLVLSNHYMGNKLIAKKLIENYLITFSKISLEENIRTIYNIYTSYMSGSKFNNWLKMYNLVKENQLPSEDYVMYKVASLLSKEKSIVVYEDIFRKYPKSDYAPEALWNVFWHSYLKKDYEKAYELGNIHLKTFQNAKSTPKIMFWLAKTELKRNKISEANSIFTKLSGKYPDNYYGLRAQSIINKKTDFFKANIDNKLPQDNQQIEFPISLSEIEIKDLKLINSLFTMGDYEIWQDADFKNPIVDSWFEYKKGNKSKSTVIARNFIETMDIKPPFVSEAYKLSYPLYYIDEINIAGKKLNLDPYLLIALIREESYFNDQAKSSTNATGLMQIMPGTANYIMSKLAINPNENHELENVRLNLYLGCNYLKYLYERFHNDLYVIAAYNGGEGSVNKWIKTIDTSDTDEFIERIPFDETRHYIKKVFRSYHMYKNIY